MTKREFGLFAFLALPGCYARWDVSPRNLASLQGYRAPATATMLATGGDIVRVDERTTLTFVRKDRAPEEHRFSSIERVDESFLVGHEATSTDATMPVAVDLTGVSRVRAYQFSVGQTVTVSVIAGIVTTAAIVGVIELAALSRSLDGYGWPGSLDLRLTPPRRRGVR